MTEPDAKTVPSPFIPGSTLSFAWDSTALGIFKECRYKYKLSIIDGWRSKGESVHLRFGSIYHSALELFDRLRATGTDHDAAAHETVAYTLRESWPWPFDNPNKSRENLVRTIVWYLEEFREDTAKTVILANGKPAVELSFRFEIDMSVGNQPYMLTGHLDKIVEFQGLQFVADKKTTKQTLGNWYFKNYEPDNQMSLYSLASKVVLGSPARGVIVDAAQIAVGFSRFDRGITYRTAAQLDEWLDDTKIYLKEAERLAETGRYPQNDKACRMCHFREVCAKDPNMRGMMLNSDFEVKRWNPLAVR